MFDRLVAEKFQIGLMSLRRGHLHLVQVPGKTARNHIYFFETFRYFLCLTL